MNRLECCILDRWVYCTYSSFEVSGSDTEAEFVLTGLLKEIGQNSTGNSMNGMVGDGAMEMYLPPENYMYLVNFKVQDLDNFQPIINQIIDDLNITRLGGVQYNHVYLDSLGVLLCHGY